LAVWFTKLELASTGGGPVLSAHVAQPGPHDRLEEGGIKGLASGAVRVNPNRTPHCATTTSIHSSVTSQVTSPMMSVVGYVACHRAPFFFSSSPPLVTMSAPNRTAHFPFSLLSVPRPPPLPLNSLVRSLSPKTWARNACRLGKRGALDVG
jgi:hypothetical protein